MDERIGLLEGIFEKKGLSRTRRILLRILFLFRPIQTLKTGLRWIQPTTYRHCKNVERVSLAVGKEYSRLFHKAINHRNLKNAAFFHDIGKLYLENDILMKKGLTAKEKWRIRKHPEYGASIIRGFFNTTVQAAVLSHHEEKSGAGYPRGIDYKKLSLLTRTISTVDDFCAMTERREYNNPIEPEKALSEIEKEIGVRYDEAIVRALKNVITMSSWRDSFIPDGSRRKEL